MIAPSSHENLAGITLTSTYVMAYIFCVDVAAVGHYHANNHEYKDYDVQRNFSLWVVYFPFIFDIICGVVLALVVLPYIVITLVIEVRHSVDHRFRQKKLKLWFKEQEKMLDLHWLTKTWLIKEIQEKRTDLQNIEFHKIVKPTIELKAMQRRLYDLQEQVKIVKQSHAMEREQQQRRTFLWKEVFEDIKEVQQVQNKFVQEEHSFMQKQQRLQQCEVLIMEQLDILRKHLKELEDQDLNVTTDLQMLKGQLIEKDRNCFLLKQAELQKLMDEENDIKIKKQKIQELKDFVSRHQRSGERASPGSDDHLEQEDKELTERLIVLRSMIDSQTSDLLSKFTSIYHDVSFEEAIAVKQLLLTVMDKLHQIQEDRGSLLMMQHHLTCQEQEILDELLQLQLDLTSDWKNFEQKEKDVYDALLRCSHLLQQQSRNELLEEPSLWPQYLKRELPKEVQTLEDVGMKLKECRIHKENLQRREFCLLQESEDFFRLHARDTQIRSILTKYSKYLRFFPIFFIISGYRNSINVAKHLNIWFISSLVYAVLVVLASHIGYILIAWLTEPQKTSSAALWGFTMCMFLFLTLRAIYGRSKDFKGFLFYSRSRKVNYCLALVSVVFLPLVFPFVSCFKEVHKHKEDSYRHGKTSTSIRKFSILGFLVAGVWGCVLVIILAFLTAAFVIVPLPTISLTEYLQNVIQVFVVVFATLVSYKIFVVHQSEFYSFFKSFNRKYIKKREKQGRKSGHHVAVDVESGLNEDEFETAGSIAANVAVRLAS